ncbi:glyoxalase [Rhizobium tropici]|uniref:Glyoxalase n=1 Tax=Rhizobium tropici TaxID=398 RepID=A0A5B0VW59_RHITR|nr:VOC family protein [Rhizobium tropici]KAA1178161.1 glyoxalase [Rhizobium tropici]
MKLRLELFVADVGASIEFYCQALSFQVIGEPSKQYTMLSNGEAAISVNSREALGSDHPLLAANGERLGLGVEIVLSVADIEGSYETARTYGQPVSELALQPWGMRDFRIMDPDGYYIRVTSGHKGTE